MGNSEVEQKEIMEMKLLRIIMKTLITMQKNFKPSIHNIVSTGINFAK